MMVVSKVIKYLSTPNRVIIPPTNCSNEDLRYVMSILISVLGSGL